MAFGTPLLQCAVIFLFVALLLACTNLSVVLRPLINELFSPAGLLLQIVHNTSVECLLLGIFLGSPLAVAEAAATLPGVHMKHDIIQNI